MKLYITLLFLIVGLLCVHASDPQPLRQLGVMASCNQFTTFSTYDGIESVSNASVENKACELTNLLGPQFGVFNFAAYPLRMFMDGEEGFEAMTNNYASAIQGAPYNKTAYLLMGRMIVTEGGDVTSYRYKIKVQFPNTGIWANLPNGYKGYIEGQVQQIIDEANNSPKLYANDIEYNVLTKFHALVVNLLAGNLELKTQELLEAEEFAYADFITENQEQISYQMSRKNRSSIPNVGSFIAFTELFRNGNSLNNMIADAINTVSNSGTVPGLKVILTDDYLYENNQKQWLKADSIFSASTDLFVLWINVAIACKEENCIQDVSSFSFKTKLNATSEQALSLVNSEYEKNKINYNVGPDVAISGSGASRNGWPTTIIGLTNFKFYNFRNSIYLPSFTPYGQSEFYKGFTLGIADWVLSFMKSTFSLLKGAWEFATHTGLGFSSVPYFISLFENIYKERNFWRALEKKAASDRAYFTDMYHNIMKVADKEVILFILDQVKLHILNWIKQTINDPFHFGYNISPIILDALLSVITGGYWGLEKAVATYSKELLAQLNIVFKKGFDDLLGAVGKLATSNSVPARICRNKLIGGCFIDNTPILTPTRVIEIQNFKPFKLF